MNVNKFINLISGMTVLSLQQPAILFSKDSHPNAKTELAVNGF